MTTSIVTDLRSYLNVLEEAGELSRVRVPVSLEQEIGAICLRNLRAGDGEFVDAKRNRRGGGHHHGGIGTEHQRHRKRLVRSFVALEI